MSPLNKAKGFIAMKILGYLCIPNAGPSAIT